MLWLAPRKRLRKKRLRQKSRWDQPQRRLRLKRTTKTHFEADFGPPFLCTYSRRWPVASPLRSGILILDFGSSPLTVAGTTHENLLHWCWLCRWPNHGDDRPQGSSYRG